MSSILYYSNYCEHSKKLLQTISKIDVGKEIHFICIDKRTKDANNKIFIDFIETGKFQSLYYILVIFICVCILDFLLEPISLGL